MQEIIEDCPLEPEDHHSLQHAKNLLENPSLVAQLTSLVGTPIEAGLKKLPKDFNKKLSKALESALTNAAYGALKTLGNDEQVRQSSWNRSHIASVAVTGGVAGFFGPWMMLAEVPLTTTIFFRSIIDIARSEGERFRTDDCIQECIAVFAMGGPSEGDDATDSGYYAVRAALAVQVQVGTQFVAKEAERLAAEAAARAAAEAAGKVFKAAAAPSSPRLVELIRKVVERLGISYSEKLAAQVLPVIGAVGGSAINMVFLNHYQCMARGHFIVRRLERKYGVNFIKQQYAKLPKYSELPAIANLNTQSEDV